MTPFTILTPACISSLSFVARTPQFANRALNMIASGWQLSGIVRRQSGNYSNDDHQQMPMERVRARAFRAAEWVGEGVLRRSVPLPNSIRLKSYEQASAPNQ